MNHNPNNVKEETIVILDDKHEVYLMNITTNSQMFSEVRGVGEPDSESWRVMTYRLKPKE